MSKRDDPCTGAHVLARLELQDGRIVTVLISASGRYAFLELHGLGLVVLDRHALKEVRDALNDAASILDEVGDA